MAKETTLNPAINPVIEPIVREFKAALQSLYGERLRGVVLYGSHAHGDYDEESDIDLTILLNDEQVNTYAEIFQMSRQIMMWRLNLTKRRQLSCSMEHVGFMT